MPRIAISPSIGLIHATPTGPLGPGCTKNDFAGAATEYEKSLQLKPEQDAKVWDRAAFAIPGLGLPNNGAIGRFGNAAPGSLIAPGTAALSMKIQKRFAITEHAARQPIGP